MDHPQAAMFESFVIGALTEEESAAFVAHVSDCDACATKLEAEARGELAIREVHDASRRGAPKKVVRRWSLAAGGAGALALAAAVLLLVLSRSQGRRDVPDPTTTALAPTAATPIPLVVCPDGLAQAKCVEEAHRHGLFVSYPPWGSAPPLGGGGRSGPGPNGSPFSAQQM